MPAWHLLYTIVAARGLRALWVHSPRKHYMRVLARALHPDVQAALLGLTSFGHAWRRQISDLFETIWLPGQARPGEASCYLAFSTQTSSWYVGKADCRRVSNGTVWAGVVLRAREHLVCTIRPGTNQAHRPRYSQWRRLDRHNLYFLPGARGPREVILSFEQMAISALQAPTQQWHARRAPQEPRAARPFPRFREYPSLERECSLNLFRQVRRSPGEQLAAGVLCFDWTSFRAWALSE